MVKNDISYIVVSIINRPSARDYLSSGSEADN